MLSRTVKLEELEEAFNSCLYRNLRYKLEDLESTMIALLLAYNTGDSKFVERAKMYLDWMLRYDLKDEVRNAVIEVKQELRKIEDIEDEVLKRRLMGDLALRTRSMFYNLAFKCVLEEL